MKTVKIIVRIGLLLVLVLVGCIAFLGIYLDSHKDSLEAGVSRLLGRQVKVENGVTMVWSMPPRVGLEGVWIGNPTWARGEYFARAERIAAEIDIWALLRGRLEVRDMTLIGADVALEAGPRGETNWTFGAGSNRGISMQLHKLRARQSSLGYQAATGPKQRVDITELELQGLGRDALTLQAEGSFRGLRLAVSARSGPSDGAGWPFTVRIRSDQAELDASGRAVAPYVLSGVTLELDAKGQGLSAFQSLFRVGPLPEAPFRISTRLIEAEGSYRFQAIQGVIDAPGALGRIAVSQGEATVSADGALAMSLKGSRNQSPASVSLNLNPAVATAAEAGRPFDFETLLGDTELSGKLTMTRGGPRPRITGDVRASRVNLGTLAGAREADGGRAAWKEFVLPRALLGAIDLDVGLTLQEAVSEPLRLDGFRTRMRLDAGRLQLERLDVSLPGLRVGGRVTLDTGRQPPAVELYLRSPSIDLPKALQGIAPLARLQGALRDVSVRLESSGATIGELVANLRGSLEAGSARLKLPGRHASELTLAQARISLAPDAPLGLRADLVFRKRNVGLQGNLDGLSGLAAGAGMALDLTLRDDDLKARVSGKLAKLDSLTGSIFSIEASGPSLDHLDPIFGIELPASEPFALTGRLLAGAGSFTLKEIKATTGETDIEGDLRIIPGPTLRLEASLNSRLIEATPYLPPGNASPDAVIAALPKDVPLELLHNLDGALRLQAQHLRVGDLGFDDLSLQALLDAGHLRLKTAAGGERLIADVELKPEQTQWRFSLKHKGKLNLSWLLESAQPSDVADEAPLALDAQLSGVGRSIHELLASADGQLKVIVGEGRFNKRLGVLVPMGDLLVTLLNTIAGSRQDRQYTSLECAVIRVDAAKGIATSPKGIGLRTDKLNVLGGGTLELGTGEIEFHFKTVQRKGLGIGILGIADKFIHFTGTLRKPQVAIDPKGVLLFGGAALATGGLSLLYGDLANRLTASVNPCELALD